MPNFKSISFKMAVLQGGGQNLPSPCVCYPKTPCGIGLTFIEKKKLKKNKLTAFGILCQTLNDFEQIFCDIWQRKDLEKTAFLKAPRGLQPDKS